MKKKETLNDEDFILNEESINPPSYDELKKKK
nr:MAG TPA_asm: hypothetical protein [Caudoviricetes sp.]